ncbi:hypothetical protein [Pontibacter fetidus]|uniref:Uncharacterized protein n=1 Tax=Pontibacter fetidus TaxID=2700082 RepID=A0A6B2GYT4_9BACT|nr:hypothetical protein [Pontibacter fetidus]NDK55171.1 hypothetical protein [Pontibacter fetidus]
MKKICFLVFMLISIAANAQQIAPDARATIVKTAVMNAVGGGKAIKGISHFSYTIHKTTYSSDTTVTRTAYTLDLNRKHIQEIQFTAADTITKWIGEDGAWLQKNGIKNHITRNGQYKATTYFPDQLYTDAAKRQPGV